MISIFSCYDYADELRDPYHFRYFSYNVEQDEERCDQMLTEAVKKVTDATEVLCKCRSRLASAVVNVSTDNVLVAGVAMEFVRLNHLVVGAEGNFQAVSLKVKETRKDIRSNAYAEYAAFLVAQRERAGVKRKMLLDLKELAQGVMDTVEPKAKAFVGQNLLVVDSPIVPRIDRHRSPLDEGRTFSVGEVVGHLTNGREICCLVAIVVKVEDKDRYWIALSGTAGEEDPYSLGDYVPYNIRFVNVSELAKCE